ncbi:vomeronasal type-2 receptor 26 [Xenopus tropicalis]|uniref:Vomeronasal type-2 receptor 26 n=1 Tax=Xenopus tropicalis TaxID=8364 RepID=A0A8J1JWW2_XENTR|nr:vomeronasal type-2 receptor 26 [Xenopus tropicalis]
MYLRYYKHILAIMFAVEEINRNPLLLPNVTLGYEIYDSCDYVSKAVEATLKLFSGRQDHVPGYRCTTKGPLAAFIGLPYSMAELTQIYRYPHISYGTQDPVLEDKRLFPSFFRIVPNDRAMYDGFVQLLHYFGWTWVGLVASDEEHHLKISQELRAVLLKSGICIAYFAVFPTEGLFNFIPVFEIIEKSNANVVITLCSQFSFLDIIYTVAIRGELGRVWITPSSLTFFTHNLIGTYLGVVNGSLQFSVHKEEIPEFKNFLYSTNPTTFHNFFTAAFWNELFHCLPPNKTTYWKIVNPLHNCTGEESLNNVDANLDVKTLRVTYTVYRAVYSFASALHEMLSSTQYSGQKLNLMKNFQPSQLSQYLKNLDFQTKDFHSANQGQIGHYDIINWVTSNRTITFSQVGSFLPFAPPGQQLIINKSDIKWNLFISSQTPLSLCTNHCPPGFRKAARKAEPICCYDCIACSEGDITNSTDMEECMACSEDHWSDEKRTMCISRTIDFLSFSDVLGITLAFVAIFLCLISLGVLSIFLKYRNTAIVKANNRELSYILLLSLIMCFLCCFLFIGRPEASTCFFRQAAFGIIFAVAVSAILAKTITVVIAFNATKPGSRARKWVGSNISAYLVSLGAFGEAVICLVWFLCSPPFPDFDTTEKSAKMTLKCNEGSEVAFYCVVGYVGLLAALSFVVAFLARKLPDTFNEATHITFSMLVFCIVWVSFIPAHVSAKGKYTVAVEIFAILASTAGLLGCIFIPKCHIIVIRPDLNTKEHLIGRKLASLKF